MGTEDDYRDDELIAVRLPRKDYEMLREMIKRQEALGWLGRYFRNVILVAIGGFMTLYTFWDSIKAIFSGLIK